MLKSVFVFKVATSTGDKSLLPIVPPIIQNQPHHPFNRLMNSAKSASLVQLFSIPRGVSFNMACLYELRIGGIWSHDFREQFLRWGFTFNSCDPS